MDDQESKTHTGEDYLKPPSLTTDTIDKLSVSSTSDEQLPQSSESESSSEAKQKIFHGRRVWKTVPVSATSSASESGQWTNPKSRLFASDFNNGDVGDLMIFYDEQPMPIDSFFKMLKEKKQWIISPVVEEDILNTFKQAVRDQLENLSIDLETITKAAKMHFETKNEDSENGRRNYRAFSDLKRNTFDSITTEAQRVNQFYKKIVTSGKYTDDNMIRLFSQWVTAVNEFMQSCVDVVRSIFHPPVFPKISPDESPVCGKEKDTCDIIYRTLFMSFSKIFLLHPRPQRKTYGLFRNKVVTSEPDVHFVQTFSPLGSEGMPMMICEVKRHEPKDRRRAKKTWIEKKISSQVLGKIGMELLSESSGSFFSPYAVGILCSRSEIMFLFLDISTDHFEAITENKSLEGKQASIHYTKTFDILKPSDRSEVMDIMFYMAAIQSYNFLFPF